MSRIIFATGNDRKIHEATSVLTQYGITIDPTKVECDEIQDIDPAQIAMAKARAAFDVLNQPVVVSDTSWSIPALGGFPGGYMKDISFWWKTEDWQAIMQRHDDKRIFCHEHVAYYDGATAKHFVQDYTGYFISEPRGRVESFESFENLVVLYGERTMAEQLNAGEVASAGEDLGHWHQFGAWLKMQ